MPKVEEVKQFFDKLNKDCECSGESVVPYTDTEYYSEQISNQYDHLEEEVCDQLAFELRQLVIEDYCESSDVKAMANLGKAAELIAEAIELKVGFETDLDTTFLLLRNLTQRKLKGI